MFSLNEIVYTLRNEASILFFANNMMLNDYEIACNYKNFSPLLHAYSVSHFTKPNLEYHITGNTIYRIVIFLFVWIKPQRYKEMLNYFFSMCKISCLFVY